jgi:hypothetical protein
MNFVISEKRESVSFDVLKDKLPGCCYDAVVKMYNSRANGEDEVELDESVYERYFNAEPPKPLTEEEQKELFENLGNKFVKNHYSTDTLRTFLEREPSQKKKRHDE